MSTAIYMQSAMRKSRVRYIALPVIKLVNTPHMHAIETVPLKHFLKTKDAVELSFTHNLHGHIIKI